MNSRKLVDHLVEEVMKGCAPKRVLEQHLAGVRAELNKEDEVLEALMAMYPDLDAEDANIFDEVMDRYYNEERFPLSMALAELLANEQTSQYFNNRLGELVKQTRFTVGNPEV